MAALGVALAIAGVHDELAAPVVAPLAASWAVTAEAVVVATTVVARWSAIASRAELVVRVDGGVLVRVALGDVHELCHGHDVPAAPLELGDEGLIAAATLEAVYSGVGADSSGGGPKILPTLDPSARRLARPLDAAIQVLDGGGAGVRVGEVLDLSLIHI